MKTDYEFIQIACDGPVMTVTFNRPEVYNAMHTPMHWELDEVFNAFAADDKLWVAVLTGAGDKAFSAGNDLKYTASGKPMERPKSGFAGITSRFDMEKPLIAAVNGVAMGGGMETALACDIIVASESARFALPEVKVGLFAGAGGVQRLSRQIGRKAAVEMMLTGRHVSGEEASELGIVNQVVPQARLMQRANEIAATLASNSPSSIKATKRLLNEMDAIERFEQSVESSARIMVDLKKTEDFTEGVTAFVEKRAPNWKNR